MSNFGEFQLAPDYEAAIASSPDVLQICSGIVDRYSSMAANYANSLPRIEQYTLANAPDAATNGVLIESFRERSKMLGEQAVLYGEILPEQTLEVAYAGLANVGFILRAHTPHIPDIFKGWTPLHENPDWPKYLHNSYFDKFGYFEEPLIGFAQDVHASNGERYRKYADLFAGAARNGRVQIWSQAMLRMPHLS